MTSAAQPGADLPGWPSEAVEQLCADDARFERVPADAAFDSAAGGYWASLLARS